ncbi:MAG TPA: PhpK family radical SAM P-methyltransferase [Pyrinomonadaceae bacterium]|nr:PhpK family radical SAM P-methyltransferase [Pyrinomonadaceae bacterium]
MATDCLIVGYNDGCLEDEIRSLRAMGVDHPNYRDLSLNLIEYEGRPYRAMDIFNRFYYEGRAPTNSDKTWHNADVLWIVILYLGTYLSKRGFTFDYINLFQLQRDELKEKLRNNEYLTTVITTTIYNFDTPIIEAVNFVREHNSKTKIIVGGPYIAKRSETMEPADLQAMFTYIGSDFYVRSREGEQALVNILRALKNGYNFATIPNIAFKNGNGFILTPSQPELNPLSENLIEYNRFPKEHIGNYVNVRITKGCPFACAFCSFPLRTEKYDVSRLDYIEHELDAIREVGTVTGMCFVDDTVNVPLPTFKEMLRMMIRRNYGFKWHCFFRADFCDEEVVELMARSGCQGVFLGLESANDHILANMNKTPRKEHYLSSIPLFKKAGIQVFASVFFGFPGETYDTAQETIDFLLETESDFYRPLIWYCDPVTPIWGERDKYGIKGYHFSWSHNTMDVATACHLVERCFMSIDTPVWVPDPGFNYVSLYMLQNRGMTFDQVKTFLRCFNAVVREKIAQPNRTETSSGLIENLKRACQFDRVTVNDIPSVPAFAAEGYRAAEAFYYNELGSRSFVEEIDEDKQILTRDDWKVSDSLNVSNSIVQKLMTDCNAARPATLIAVFMATQWLAENCKDSTVVLSLEDSEIYPVRLAVHPSATFRGLAQLCQKTIDATQIHSLYALPVMLSLRGMPAPRVSHPIFKVAYLESDTIAGPQERLRYPSSVYGGLTLILTASPNRDDLTLRFIYSSSTRGADAVEKLRLTLEHVLKTTTDDPETGLYQLGASNRSTQAVVSSEHAPQFAF